jgi:hypothetical protein
VLRRERTDWRRRQRLTIVDRLVATAVTMVGDQKEVDARIDIVIERWSSDEQENILRTNINGGAPKLLAALQVIQRRIGFVLSPGVQGTGARARGRRARNIQFAHEIQTPTGRQVVIATDSTWDSASRAASCATCTMRISR